jgi:hypothetical protein
VGEGEIRIRKFTLKRDFLELPEKLLKNIKSLGSEKQKSPHMQISHPSSPMLSVRLPLLHLLLLLQERERSKSKKGNVYTPKASSAVSLKTPQLNASIQDTRLQKKKRNA